MPEYKLVRILVYTHLYCMYFLQLLAPAQREKGKVYLYRYRLTKKGFN